MVRAVVPIAFLQVGLNQIAQFGLLGEHMLLRRRTRAVGCNAPRVKRGCVRCMQDDQSRHADIITVG